MKKNVLSLFMALVLALSLIACLGITAFADNDEEPGISFYSNGGTGYMAPVMMNGNFPLPECGFTAPEGYRFKCWLVNDWAEMQPGETVYVDCNTSAAALWEAIPSKLIFGSGGGTGLMEEVELFGDYTLPECGFTAPEGQQFKCWSLNGQALQPGETVYVDSVLTLEAVWTEIPVVETPEPAQPEADTPLLIMPGNAPSEDGEAEDDEAEAPKSEDRDAEPGAARSVAVPLWVILLVAAVVIAAVSACVTVLILKKK